MKAGYFVPGVNDYSVAASNLSVFMARKYYAEVFDIPLSAVPQPNSAVRILRIFFFDWRDWVGS